MLGSSSTLRNQAQLWAEDSGCPSFLPDQRPGMGVRLDHGECEKGNLQAQCSVGALLPGLPAGSYFPHCLRTILGTFFTQPPLGPFSEEL